MKSRTKKPRRALSCTGKQKYDRAGAEDMARYRASQDGSLMDAYRCQYGCTLPDGSPAWHIGHKLISKGMISKGIVSKK